MSERKILNQKVIKINKNKNAQLHHEYKPKQIMIKKKKDQSNQCSGDILCIPKEII